MKKSTLTANDLEQLFGSDSDFSGSASGGEEGEEVYTYRGSSFCPEWEGLTYGYLEK